MKENNVDTVPRLSIKKAKKIELLKKNRRVIQLFRLQKNFNLMINLSLMILAKGLMWQEFSDVSFGCFGGRRASTDTSPVEQ